jgi:hypothetical protein
MRLGSGRNQAPARLRSEVGRTHEARIHYVAPSVANAQRHTLFIATGVVFDAQDAELRRYLMRYLGATSVAT